MNFVVFLKYFLYIGCIIFLSIATIILLSILLLTTLPIRVFLLPLFNSVPLAAGAPAVTPTGVSADDSVVTVGDSVVLACSKFSVICLLFIPGLFIPGLFILFC